MKLQQFALLTLLCFAISSCIKGPDIKGVIESSSLELYSGARVLDQDLNKKLRVYYPPRELNNDTAFAKRDRRFPIGLTSKNRYDYYHIIYFEKDEEVLIDNFRQELLKLLSTQPFHTKIDSLRIDITQTEAFVPYFDGSEMVAINGSESTPKWS